MVNYFICKTELKMSLLQKALIELQNKEDTFLKSPKILWWIELLWKKFFLKNLEGFQLQWNIP